MILQGLTPYEHVRSIGKEKPERSKINPPHQIPVTYIQNTAAMVSSVDTRDVEA